MAELTTQRKGQLLKGLFTLLSEQPEGLPAREAISLLERRVPPTEFERADYPLRPGDRRFDKIVRFVTIPAVKAGWLVKDKGHWTLTDQGRQAVERFSDPVHLMEEVRRLYRTWRQDQPIAGPSDDGGDEEEEAGGDVEVAVTTLEEAEEAAWSEVQRYLLGMNPYEFQDLVAALLKGMGYHVGWVAPPGPDAGVDIIAHPDPLGASGPRIKVQVKRRADRVSVEGIRSFMAMLNLQDIGLYVSAGGFTSDAAREARLQESRRLSLIDLRRFFDLWVEHYDRVPEPERRLLPLKPVHFLAPLT